MTNSTQTFWDVDGVSLQTLAWNITTLGGDRAAPPGLRGGDEKIPYMPGSRWTPRVVDSRTITLGMWVIGANEDGSAPLSGSRRLEYEQNWRKLRKLLWTPRRQFTLTKRFWLPTAELTAGGIDTTSLPKLGSYALYTARAKGSFAGGLEPTMNGPGRASFTVDIFLSDPYFYGDAIEVPFSTQTGGSNPGPNRTLQVLGDDRTTAVEIDFDGPLTSPRFTNLDAGVDLWVQYGSEIADGESATVKVSDFAARHYLTGSNYRSSGYVQHAGDRFWFFLEPGETDLKLTKQAGTGVASLRYKPVWF